MHLGCWLSLFGIIGIPVLRYVFLLAHHEEHSCVAPARHSHSARWIGNRRHRHIRMRHRKNTSHRRKQYLFDAHCVITIAEISLGLLIVSWKIGLLGIRVGEAAVPGPDTTAQTQPNGANHIVSETRGGGRAHLREAHSDVPLCLLQHIEKRSRERTHRHAYADQNASSRMEVAGVV